MMFPKLVLVVSFLSLPAHIAFAKNAAGASFPDIKCSIFTATWNAVERRSQGQSLLKFDVATQTYLSPEMEKGLALSFEPFMRLTISYAGPAPAKGLPPLVEYRILEDSGGNERVRAYRRVSVQKGTRQILSGTSFENPDSVFTVECEVQAGPPAIYIPL